MWSTLIGVVQSSVVESGVVYWVSAVQMYDDDEADSGGTDTSSTGGASASFSQPVGSRRSLGTWDNNAAPGSQPPLSLPQSAAAAPPPAGLMLLRSPPSRRSVQHSKAPLSAAGPSLAVKHSREVRRLCQNICKGVGQMTARLSVFQDGA